MRLSLRTVFTVLLSCSLLHTSITVAGMFKWVDDKGEIHYGDSVPPEYADTERKQLNEGGRTVKVYAAVKTPEEIAAAQRLEDQRLKQEKLAVEEARKDHVLLATYSSEEDMLKTRDGKLSAIEGLIQLTQRRITSMDKRMKQLTEDAADYERGGKPIPDVLTRQIENIRTQTAENESFIQAKQKDQAMITAQFKKHIARFRELTDR